MLDNHKVVAITPAGRKPNLEILETYVMRNQECKTIDKWMIWVNTPHKNDIEFINLIKERHPDFVELVQHPESPISRPMPQPAFFPTATEKGTVYVKIDDDICWMDPYAIVNLIRFRLENRDSLFVMSNTICNGFCAYLHAKFGSQDFMIDGEYQRIPPEFSNKVWSDVKYAEYVHRTFLEDWCLNQRTIPDHDGPWGVEKYKFSSWTLDHYQRVAINCIAWMGDDFAEFGGKIDHIDEELWLCCIKAKQLQRPAVICGDSLVAHHAFYKHRKPHCAGKEIDSRILRAYKYIAGEHSDGSRAAETVRKILNAKIM